MRPVATAAEVRAADAGVIERLGVPGIALMELASKAVAEVVATRFADRAKAGTVVVCGAGNNGGDGYGVARWLQGWGFPTALVPLTTSSDGDAGVMRAVAGRMGIPTRTDLGDAGLIVDAVFGTGLARPVSGRYAEVIRAMDAHLAPVVAVDLPSGVHADTGAVLGVAVRAAATVTFGMHKRAMFAGAGADLCGEVFVADIGLSAANVAISAELPYWTDLERLRPKRAPNAHKRDSGHLLVVAGSAAMAGAAVLCCRGALAGGVGLCTLAVPKGAFPRLGTLPPEVMAYPAGDGDRVDPDRLPDPARFDALVAGPGLGGGAPLEDPVAFWLKDQWQGLQRPVLFDADALPYALGSGPAGVPRVITPHPGEAGRLLGRSGSEVEADRFGAVRVLGEGRTALLKGRYSLVSEADAPISVNPTGNPVLASGGTGDVLAGLIGALLAAGATGRDAARLGAWVHGAAADRLAARRAGGWTAADVAAEIPFVTDDGLPATRQ